MSSLSKAFGRILSKLEILYGVQDILFRNALTFSPERRVSSSTSSCLVFFWLEDSYRLGKPTLEWPWKDILLTIARLYL
jgi:hypothetical protein